MKSTILCVLIALALGVGLGAALGYYEARPWAMQQALLNAGKETPQPSAGSSQPTGPDVEQRPLAQIDETTFHFDKMERGTSMSHEFTISNNGNVPLNVTFLSHTCKCTSVKLNGKEVEENDGEKAPPGEHVVVELEWVAKTEAGPFRHGATLETSDPQHSTIELTVEGDIVESSTLSPSQIHFSGARIGDTVAQEALVVAFIEPDVQILSHRLEISPPELAKQLQVRVEDVPQDALPSPDAQAAARVVVTLDAAGTVGSFQGELELTTNLKSAPKLTLPITGTIKGDISIYGQGWNPRTGLLNLGTVRSESGSEAKFNVMVRGPLAAATQIHVKRTNPPELKATLSDPIARGDQLVQFPLVVEVPVGTRPMVLAGESGGIAASGETSTDGKEGEIVLQTTHPEIPEVRLRVHLAVTP